MKRTLRFLSDSTWLTQIKQGWQSLLLALFLFATFVASVWIAIVPVNKYEWMLEDPQVETVPYDPDTGLYANLTLAPVILVLLAACLVFKGRKRYALLCCCVLPLSLYWGMKFGTSFIQQNDPHPDVVSATSAPPTADEVE